MNKKHKLELLGKVLRELKFTFLDILSIKLYSIRVLPLLIH